MYNRVPVDINQFNLKLFYCYNHVRPTTDTSGELVVLDLKDGDTVFSHEQPFYYETSNEEKQLVKNESIEQKMILYKEYDSDNDLNGKIDLIINYYLTRIEHFDTFITYYGFVRVRNYLKNVIFSKTIRMYSEDEVYIIQVVLDYLVRYRMKWQKREYMFVCYDCNMIDEHRIPRPFKGTKPEDRCDTFKIKWFNSAGALSYLKFGDIDEDLKQKKFIDSEDKLTGFIYNNKFRLGHKTLSIKSLETEAEIYQESRILSIVNQYEVEYGFTLSNHGLGFESFQSFDEKQEFESKIQSFYSIDPKLINLLEYSQSIVNLFEYIKMLRDRVGNSKTKFHNYLYGS